MEEYLEEKRKSGKSDAEIIKEATSKAGLFMMMMMALIMVAIVGMIMLTGGDPEEISNGLSNAVKVVFPKFG